MQPPKLRPSRTSWRLSLSAALLFSGPLLSACQDGTDDMMQLEEPSALPDIAADPVSATFTLKLDAKHPSLGRQLLDPSKDPITVTTVAGGEALALDARVKRVPARSELLWVELFFENRSPNALRGVTVSVETGASTALYDLSNDPFAEATTNRSILVGGIGPEGIGRIAIGLPSGATSHELTLTVRGTTTRRVATASAPIAMSPDGEEVWAVQPDAELVAVIGTKTDQVAERITVPGRPTSIAITADGRLVLLTSASQNRLHVFERKTRKLLQTFGESDGIGREPQHLVLSPDGSHAYVSAYVGDTITSLKREGLSFRVEGSVAVGRRPSGMAVAPDGGTLLVSHYLPRGTTMQNEGFVSVLATQPLQKTREIVLQDAFNLDKAACMANLFMLPPILLTTEGVPTQLSGVFLEPGGSSGMIGGGRAASAPVAERGPKAVSMSPLTTPRPGEFATSFLFYLDTRDPAKSNRFLSRGMVERPVDIRYVKCEQFGEESESILGRDIPGKPGQQAALFSAFPTGVDNVNETGIRRFVAYSRGGRRALTLAYNSDELSVVDVMTHHAVAKKALMLSGSNPTGLVVSPDGRKGYVTYANSLFVSVLDLSGYAETGKLPAPSFVPYEYREVPELGSGGGLPGSPNKLLVRYINDLPEQPPIREIGQVAVVDKDPMTPAMRRGRILFESSNPEKHPKLAAHRMGACIVCHPNGGSDGFLWGTMEGERRTMSLRGGVSGRGWLHVSGTHQDITEFADAIVKERLGGELPAADREALSGWVATGIPKLQAPKVDAALAARGQELFQKNCAGCHQGPLRTSGNADPASPFGGGKSAGPMLYDVGTATADAHVIFGKFFEQVLPKADAEIIGKLRGDRDLGAMDPVQVALDFRPRPERKRGQFKAPALVDLWDSVVYGHDGRFADLKEAVRYFSAAIPGGLGDADQAAIVEYLKSL